MNQSTLIATQRGNRDADGNQAWAVVRGHEIDGEVLCEDLSERDAKLFAAAPELFAALNGLSSLWDDSGVQSDVMNALRPHERKSFLRLVENAAFAIAKAKGGAT